MCTSAKLSLTLGMKQIKENVEKHPARICDLGEKKNQQEQNAMKSKLLYIQSASKTHGLIWVLEGENNLLSEKKNTSSFF